MHHVRELDSVSNEEHWQIIAYQIVVPVFGVELRRKTPRIACRISRSSGAYHSGETDENRCFLLRVLKEFRAGVLRHTLIDLEVAMGTGALGVHYTLWNALTVEVRKFLNEVYIL
jgi:hypothetical protein